MNSIKVLLRQANVLIEIEKVKHIARRERGEDFNVFSILKLYSQEVRLHSAFLSELLDSNGSHGLNDNFLKAFIDVLDSPFNFETADSKVKVEYSIGEVSETGGGRIDILIETKNGTKAIIIENKIYAPDVKKQLLRYHNFAINKYRKNNYSLLYLTLDGKKASKESTESVDDVTYTSISYETHIIKWLNRCLELATNHPSVREIIRQYLSIINQLTGKNMEKNHELTTLLKQKHNIITTLDIIGQSDDVFTEVKKLFIEDMKVLAKEMGMIFENGDAAKDMHDSIFSFRKKEWVSKISFVNEDGSWYWCIDDNYKKIEKSKYSCFDKAPSDGAPYGSSSLIFTYRNWSNLNTLKDMANGKFKEYVKECINKINEGIQSGEITME
ncbi:PD-(D/E)XK nuclease family protein [Parabacteroides sp. OttesenSCG-928-G06]|nr:PD-(D/E)XK nuclease family protein [Parabacteroides sp. OttesenSCG-928-G06]